MLERRQHRRSRARQWRLTAVGSHKGSPGFSESPNDVLKGSGWRCKNGVQHVADRPDAFGYVEHLWLERLPPRKGGQLARELGGAVHRVRDGFNVPDPPLFGQVGTAQEVGCIAPRRSSLLPRLADALLHDGELLDVRLAPLAMMLPELLQQAYLEVHIHGAGIDRVALALVFKVDVSQSSEERLEQGLKIRGVQPRLGLLLGRLCEISFVVGHHFPPCLLTYSAGTVPGHR